MAERRMFAKSIIDSDVFLDMPVSSQTIYFHLAMRADDDGFVNNPKKIVRMVNGSGDDLELLIAQKFIIPFESGVVVIKHWQLHNYIKKDRYKPTIYQNEKDRLEVKDNTYQLMDTECIQHVSNLDSQVRLGKVRLELGKDRLDSTGDSIEPPTRSKKFVIPTLDEVRSYCIEINSTIDPESFVDYYATRDWMAGNVKMKDWKAAIRTWEKNEFRYTKPADTRNEVNKDYSDFGRW